MLSVFLLQLAGGCMLAIGLCRIDDMPWRYLRLVAVVSLAALLSFATLLVIEGGLVPFTYGDHTGPLMIAGVLALSWSENPSPGVGSRAGDLFLAGRVSR